MDSKTKQYLIILVICLVFVIIWGIFGNSSKENKKLKKYAIKHNYTLNENGIYETDDNFLYSILDHNLLYDTRIRINIRDNIIEATSVLNGENIEFEYNLSDKMLIVSYVNNVDGMTYNELRYNYKNDTYDCKAMIETSDNRCDDLKTLANKFKEHFTI